MGCTRNIYKKNLVKASRDQVEKNPYGSYIEVDSKIFQHLGEFISYERDTLFMMTEVGFEKIISDDILRIQIILSRNRARGYLIATGIVAIPALIGTMANPDYSEEFMPNAKKLGEEVFVLQVHPTIEEAHLLDVVNAIDKVLDAYGR